MFTKSTMLSDALALFNPLRGQRKPVPTGGHRNPDYKPDAHDLHRVAQAQLKRERKGAKMRADAVSCKANNYHNH